MTSYNKIVPKLKGNFINLLKHRSLTPSPRVSNGLSDAYADLIGGEPLQDNISGNTSGATFTVVAGGVTGKQIVIPEAWHGGNIVNVRGLYATSAVPRYDSFTADFNAGDTTNYADFTQVASNNYAAGVLSTTIPVLASVAVGTVLQAYYSYRTGVLSAKGEAMSGYPMLHVDAYQGTANDGDNYLMMSLYHAFNSTGKLKYKLLADRIGLALLDAGRWSTNRMPLSLDINLEAGQDGIYWYNAPTTPMDLVTIPRPDAPYLNCLRITTVVNSGGPPYNYAGFGNWFSFPVSSATPFHSLDFLMKGDGSQRNLELTTNVTIPGTGSFDVGALIPLLSTENDKHYQFSITPDMFWKTGNVVYDARHKDFSYYGTYSGGSSYVDEFEDLTNRRIIKRFHWDFDLYWYSTTYWIGYPFPATTTLYGGFYFGAAADSSAGTTAFNFDIYSEYAGLVTISATDSSAVKHSVLVNLAAGWQSLRIPWIGVPWVGFSQTTFAHPVTGFNVDAYKNVIAAGYTVYPDNSWRFSYTLSSYYVPEVFEIMNHGVFMIDNARYDSVTAMSGLAYDMVNGFQLSFPSNSSGQAYDICLADININQTIIDGTPADPTRYMGIPRWTYKWIGAGLSIGYGSWRGPSAVGYNWLSGWTQSGIINPDNGRNIGDAMRQMMLDSQNEYVVQFPGKLIGPFVPRYGRVSWEAAGTSGWVSGVQVASTYNQWYWPDTDDWYGYTVRALLSVAGDYYMTRHADSKLILDRWMAWLDVNIIADGAWWWPPSGYGNDGNPTYTYHPVYSYTCIAAACIYKYWVDGDPIALKWYRRLLDDIFARKRMTGTGSLQGISRTTEGVNYETATVYITGDGTGASATANIHGGKITSYSITAPGSGYTWIYAEVYAVVSSWDVSTVTYAGKMLSAATQDSAITGLTFKPDGLTAYVVGGAGNVVYQYNFTAAWDISTGSYSGKSFSVAAQSTIAWGISFSLDGLTMYICDQSNKTVYQYMLSVAWDISTAFYANKSLAMGIEDNKPRGISFNPTGTSLYVAGYSNDHVYQYALAVAWDVSSGSYSGKNIWVGAQDSGDGVVFKSDGSTMYVVGHFTNYVYQYALSTNWDISTASYVSKQLSITGQDTAARALFIRDDGISLFVAGQANNAVYQYALTTTGTDGGTGATCNAYLNDLLVGAFDPNHTGWELAEIYNTYAMLVIPGGRPGGTVSYPTTVMANDIVAMNGIYELYQRNKGTARPSFLTENGVPFHEYDIDPYHNGSAIENPMIKDTHVRGAIWTETIGPTLYAAVEYGRWSDDWDWLDQLFALCTEMAGSEDLDYLK